MPPAPTPLKRWVAPPPELRPYVDRFWSWHARAGTPLPTALPGTGAEVFIHLGSPFVVRRDSGTSERAPAAHVLCPRARVTRLVAEDPVAFVAVRFRAGALRHFTDVPLRELDDRFVELADVFGPSAVTLPERLHDAAGDVRDGAQFRRGVAVLASSLRDGLAQRQRHDPRTDRAITRLYYAAGREPIATSASWLGVGVRQLERDIRAALGLTPKHFARLARFHHAARRLFVEPETRPFDVAIDLGYADQSHFIHEVRALTGSTPGVTFARDARLTHFYNSPRPALPEDRLPYT